MVAIEAQGSSSEAVDGIGSTYALLHEDSELALILNVDELLAAIGRVGDVQLETRTVSGRVHACNANVDARIPRPLSILDVFFSTRCRGHVKISVRRDTRVVADREQIVENRESSVKKRGSCASSSIERGGVSNVPSCCRLVVVQVGYGLDLGCEGWA